MSSFKFNFSGESSNDSKTTVKNETIEWLECEEVKPGDQLKCLDENASRVKLFLCGDVEIEHLIVSEALAKIEGSGFKSAVELAEKEHSDLIAGKYEGGLKIWECTYDLVAYLEDQDDITLELVEVLDLGCGAGILGIYAIIKGGTVTFQDYNKEVLEHVTIPNLLLNFDEDERENELNNSKFYSGDWASFNEKLGDTVYDVILTCETIYNEQNYDKLIDFLIKRLNKDGYAFVAAKSCYFGVGGGIGQFEKALEINGKLRSEKVWKSSGGIQREIIRITHKDNQFY